MNSKLNRKRAAESETKDSDSETPQPTKDKKQKAAKKKSPKKVTFLKYGFLFITLIDRTNYKFITNKDFMQMNKRK